jgi:hypothetical protein
MRSIAIVSDAVAAVFFTEAWAAPASSSRDLAPSEHPNRQEMVVVMGTHRTFGSKGASALVLVEGKTIEDPAAADGDQSKRVVGEWLFHEPNFHNGFGKVVFTEEERASLGPEELLHIACKAYVEMNNVNLVELDRVDPTPGAPA